MKKILLIQPLLLQENLPPLSLMYLASILENKRFKVKIIDMNTEKDYTRKIITYVKKERPAFVGFSVIIGLQILFAKFISKKIKKINPLTKIVWGGPFPSSVPETIIINEYVDVVVVGEGELTFLELATNIEKNNLKKVKGIVFKDGENIIKTKPRNIIDMNILPTPSWHLINIHKYAKCDIFLNVTRGCPYNCEFCFIPTIGKLRGKSAKKIIEEINILLTKYAIRNINFSCEGFLFDRERINKLTYLIKKNNLNFEWESWMNLSYILRGFVPRV
ncbi:MAG: cobalamin B12-binding domain-containing protein [DPANN group archaeon]|nr:cobalamin B12-binding domain-containing protein [DPANN group archaeon]